MLVYEGQVHNCYACAGIPSSPGSPLSELNIDLGMEGTVIEQAMTGEVISSYITRINQDSVFIKEKVAAVVPEKVHADEISSVFTLSC